MKDALTEIVGNEDAKPKAEQYQAKADKKPTSDKKPGRRGVWKKIRVRPADGFETAESQNIGNHFFNSLNDNAEEKKEVKTKDYSIEFHEVEDQEKKVEKVEPTIETSTEYIEPENTASPQESTTVAPVKEEFQGIPIEDVFSKSEDPSTEIPESEESFQKTEKKSELIEVAKQALTDLFHFASEEVNDESDDIVDQDQSQDEFDSEFSTSTTTFAPELATTLVPEVEKKTEESTVVKEEPNVTDKKPAVIVGTSTSTEISHETEICYRGRCIKTDKNKNKKI